MTHETQCSFCDAGVTLEVIDTPQPIRAWRMFECPFCLRTNFLPLPGQISSAVATCDPGVFDVRPDPREMVDAGSPQRH